MRSTIGQSRLNSVVVSLPHRQPAMWQPHFRLCACHFASSDFTSPERNRLLPNALPTLFLRDEVAVMKMQWHLLSFVIVWYLRHQSCPIRIRIFTDCSGLPPSSCAVGRAASVRQFLFSRCRVQTGASCTLVLHVWVIHCLLSLIACFLKGGHVCANRPRSGGLWTSFSACSYKFWLSAENQLC